jgi:hypothetical protein
MPGWFIHMDVARKALSSLSTNPGAAAKFTQAGLSAAQVQSIATSNPTYAALGAIGPDIFFLLPDFKPPMGTYIWGAANTIKEIFDWWDEHFLGPWEEQIGPVADNLSDEVDAITGGLASQLSSILSQAFKFLIDTVAVLGVRSYDVYGILGSGVPSGYDEQVFFWADMFHYRKTYDFARALWRRADAENNDRFRAFALGWMTHLATDVTGHAFVNQKVGAAWRLHWQRHHLVENHMDGKAYDNQHGNDAVYNMLSNAALHLWLAFNPDGSSRNNFFADQPGPTYATGDKTPDILDRKSKWDVDSVMPADLAQFLSEVIQEVYTPENTGSPNLYDTANPGSTEKATGQWACCPTIITELSDDVPGVEPPPNVTKRGYVSEHAMTTAYWWLYHFLKWITTDYYKLRRPEPPEFIHTPPFPSPPGTGTSDPGPGPDDHNAWHDILEILLAIFAWIIYLAEVAAWPVDALVSLITSAGTYPFRYLIYEYLELPLYNAWLALHWYLTMTGFVFPMQSEIHTGLTKLGVGVTDVWQEVLDALADPFGGLHTLPLTTMPEEPSGSDVDRTFPHGPVTDDPSTLIQFIIEALGKLPCASDPRIPSEFRRPWLWPDHNNDATVTKTERSAADHDGFTGASPYVKLQDVGTLLSSMPGDQDARDQLETAKNEAETIELVLRLLKEGKHLGDPVDYAAYVVAELTREDGDAAPANFNLDADRGYGYLCWDWLRSPTELGTPNNFKGNTDQRRYHAPVAAGYGWCDKELQNPGVLQPWDPDPATTAHPVKLRYLDRQMKTPSPPTPHPVTDA